jgi:DNA-3-methyladenine glycosylase
MKLDNNFYQGDNVVDLAKQLLGMKLCTRINNQYTSGIITETEAYAGASDKASHAYNNRRTKRTEIMFANGGCAYIYLCYGIHHLFNVVTNTKEIPHAILIRSILPVDGIETMIQRKNKKLATNIGVGPGNVSKCLGLNTSFNGTSLLKNVVWIENSKLKISSQQITIGPRVGIDYAGDDAKLPYRFVANIK